MLISKDTPEVGDIWINKTGTKKYYVVSLGNNYVYCLVKGLGISTKYYDLFRNYTYLDKSKANINDLFKTENEE